MELGRLFNSYDVGCAYASVRVRRPKEFIGALIGAATGLAGSLFGGAASAAANRRAEARMEQQKAANDAWYKRRYNEDYLDTAAGRNLVRQAREIADEHIKRAQGAQAVGGGTEASVAVAKEKANKMIGDTMSNIAAQDTARKANADAQHHQDQQNYTNQQVALEQQKGDNIAQVASGVGNALGSIGGALDDAGVFTKKSVGV